jgi:valyl-tRNA synthetase
MPFLTEEIWHLLADRDENDCIMIARLPERHRINHKVLEQFNFAKDVIIAVRGLRNEKNIPMKEQLQFFVKKNHSQQADTTFDGLASKLCNLAAIEYVEEKVANAMSFVVGSTEFYIPLTGVVDLETELKKLEDDLAYTNNFLNSVVKKLENERFVSGAPEAVVDLERKKQADAENKIKVLEEQIANLKGLTKS